MATQSFLTATMLVFSSTAMAADWDNFPIPATAPDGTVWQLTDMSDDFNYHAPANGKSEEFYSRWSEGFINSWTGPGLTQWNPSYSEVRDGYLRITTGRNTENGNVFAGSITSKASFTYPMYMEVRAKISNMVTASNFWALSKDSTQEIDVLEAYGSDREGQEWFAERLHLSHHVFIREPFQDYQPKTDDTWFARDGIKWKDDFHTIGVYWRDPWHLEYYVDGQFIKSSSGKDIIDPLDYTEGTGLSKPMQAIINTESHDWRSDQGIAPTDAEMADPERNIYLVDWVRFYKPVTKYAADNQAMWQQGESQTIEFGSFDQTGKDGPAVDSDAIEGFNVAGDNISHNTAGDWAEYTVDIGSAGYFRLDYLIASPTTGDIGAELYIDGKLISTTDFASTGSWQDYQFFSEKQPLQLESAGTYQFKIKSVGDDVWQWNGDEFQLVALTPTEQNDIDAARNDSHASDDNDVNGDDANGDDANGGDAENGSSDETDTADESNDNTSTGDSSTNGDSSDSSSNNDTSTDQANSNDANSSASGGAIYSPLIVLLSLLALRRRFSCVAWKR